MRRDRVDPRDEMSGDGSVIKVRIEPVHLRETDVIDNRAKPTKTRDVDRAVGGRGAVDLQRRGEKRCAPQQELRSQAQRVERRVRFARGVGNGSHDCSKVTRQRRVTPIS